MALSAKANKLFKEGLIPGDIDEKAQAKIDTLSTAEINAVISVREKLKLTGRMFKRRKKGGATTDCGF
jgi:hypothetical protein